MMGTYEKITRRQTLQLMASTAVFGGAVLAGCGGGGASIGSSGGSVVPTTGASQLPTGFKLLKTDLTGGTVFGGGKLAANGSFSTKVLSNGGPTVAWLLHGPTKKFVLYGFVGNGQKGVSALGTATLLIVLSLSGLGLPPAAQNTLVSNIESHSATASLASVISQRVAADPFALSNSDTQIIAALKGACKAITASKQLLQPGSGTRGETIAPLLTVDPSQQLSMAQVVQASGGADGIQVMNLGRRPIAAYTYRIGQEDTSGVRTDLTQAVLVGQRQDLLPVEGVIGSVVGTGHRPAFQPVKGPVVPLPVVTGSAKTFYETVVLMASGKTADEPEPSFFSLPRYSGQLETWRHKREELNMQGFFGGALRDLVGSLIGGVSATLSGVTLNSIIAELGAIQAAAVQQVIDFTAKGFYTKATKTIFEIARGSDLVSGRIRQTLIDLIPEAEQAGLTALSEEVTLALIGLASLVLEVLAIAGTLLAVVDLGFSYSDLLTSSKGEIWHDTAIKPSVVVSPQSTELGRGHELTLTARVLGVTGAFTYSWRLEGGGNLASMRDSLGHTGMAFETTKDQVTVATTPSTQGTLTVTVEAFRTVNGARTSAGTGTARIDMSDAVDPLIKWEKVKSGVLQGAYSFFFAIPIVSTVDRYNIKIIRKASVPPRTDEYWISGSAYSLGLPVPDDVVLNSSAPQLVVHRVSGIDFPNAAFHRGNYIYYAAVTTTNHGQTEAQFVADMIATLKASVDFIVTTE